MKFYYQMITMVAIFLLAACSTTQSPTTAPEEGDQVTPTVSFEIDEPTEQVEGSGYPAPEQDQAYPAPDDPDGQSQDEKPVPTQILDTPDPDLGLVEGVMLLNDQPVTDAILYMAGLIYNEAGDSLVRFSRTESIRTTTDQDGRFIFVNLPPGEYGLVLDIVRDSYLLSYPVGDQIILKIEAGDRIDLGVLNYDFLPIPP